MPFLNALLAAIIAIAVNIGPSAAPAVAPPAKPQPAATHAVVVKHKPTPKPKPKRFTAPHVVSATTEVGGILWVVTDLPLAASSIPTARSICQAATAYQQQRGAFKGVSVRAKGDAGRLSLRMTLAQPC